MTMTRLTVIAASLSLAAGAAAADGFDPAALFHGHPGSGVQVRVAGSATALDARRFPCANCHGADGQGDIEGSRRIPPLVARHNDPPPDAAELLLALTQGLAADGRSLDPLMPRYAIDAENAESLVAFLQGLGDSERRGVTPGQVVFLVPPGGPAEALAASFAEGFAEGVAGRRAWGREIALTRDPSQGALAALALASAVAEDPAIPLIAPMGPIPVDDARNVRLLCAPPRAQIAALIGSLPPGTTVRIVGEGSLADEAQSLVPARASDADSTAVLLLTAQPPALPDRAQVLALKELLGEAKAKDLAARGHPVTLSDGCGELPGAQGLSGLERAELIGRLTGRAVWEALSGAGRDLSRSRLVASLDARAESDPAVPSRSGADPVLLQIAPANMP